MGVVVVSAGNVVVGATVVDVVIGAMVVVDVVDVRSARPLPVDNADQGRRRFAYSPGKGWGGRADGGGIASSAQPKDRSRLGSGGNLHLDAAFQGRYIDSAAERHLRKPQRQLADEERTFAT